MTFETWGPGDAPESLWAGFGNLLGGAVRVISSHIVASLLTRAVFHFRPSLAPSQRSLLHTHFETLFDALLSGSSRRANASRQLRGLLCIICYDLPQERRDALFDQLVAILRSFDLQGLFEDEPDAVVYDDDDGVDDGSNVFILERRLRVSPTLIARIPKSIRSALVAELTRVPPPSCSITLEEVVGEHGRICSDVIALVQRRQSSSTPSSNHDGFHVFLYKGAALDNWFQIGGHINPLTRERVHASSQLFPLS